MQKEQVDKERLSCNELVRKTTNQQKTRVNHEENENLWEEKENVWEIKKSHESTKKVKNYKSRKIEKRAIIEGRV